MIKKLTLILCILLCAASARAITITIAAQTFFSGAYQYGGSTATVRIYATKPFIASDSTAVPAGAIGTNAFFKTVSCTVASNTLTCPSFTLPSTTDALDDQTARFVFVLYDHRGIRRDTLYANIRGGQLSIPANLGSNLTFAQIAISNQAAVPLRDTSVYTKTETNTQIALALAAASAAPNAPYLTQTPDATLTSEQAMSLLDTGLVKNTTGTGVQSIAVGGVDYEVPLSFGTGLTRTVNAVALTAPGTLTVSSTNTSAGNHTHAVTSNSDPGAAASLLATNASGHLSLVRLNTDTLADRSGGNLTVSPAGDLILDPTGNDALPNTNYDINLGALNKKYLTLHAAELWAETLVAQNTQATIGGRVLVAPTNILTADLGSGAGDTTITVKYNNFLTAAGANCSGGSPCNVYMEADGKVEFFWVVSAASGSAGAYTYTVERDKDGSGRNAWFAGDAIVSTVSGFIDIYSVRGIKSASEAGPTIVGNVRASSTYNDWSPRWAIGNLNGLYGYSTNEYGVALGVPTAANILIDPTNGIRIRHNTTDKIVLDAAGNASFTGAITASSGTIGGFDIGADYIRDAANSFGLASTVTGGDDVRFWAGNTFTNRATAPFRLTEAGAATMTNLTATGTFTLNSGAINGPLTMSGASSSIAIGTTPPTSATAGTGIWLDRTGLYSLVSDNQHVRLDQVGINFPFAGGLIDSTVVGTLLFKAFGQPSGTTGYIGLRTANNGSTQVGEFYIKSSPGATWASLERGGGTLQGFVIGSTTGSAPEARLDVWTDDSVTNALTDVQILRHNSTSTPVANFGGSVLFKLESSTTENRDAARIGTQWNVATDATRSSKVVVQTVDNAGALAQVAQFAGEQGGGTVFGSGTYNLVNSVIRPIVVGSSQSFFGAVVNNKAVYMGNDGTTMKIDAYDYGGSVALNIYLGGNGGHVLIPDGLVVGSPTGGHKGSGTVNATAIYDDNVLLTDWIFSGEKPDKLAPYKRLFGLDETLRVTQTEHRLPWMPLANEFERERNVGGMVTRLWQGQEQQQLYIFELERRIRDLEKRLEAKR